MLRKLLTLTLLLSLCHASAIFKAEDGEYDINCDGVLVTCLTSPKYCSVSNRECTRVVSTAANEVSFLVRRTVINDNIVATVPYRTNADGSQDSLLCYPSQGQRFIINSKPQEPIVFTSGSLPGGVYHIGEDGFLCTFSDDEVHGLAQASLTELGHISVFPLVSNATLGAPTPVFERSSPDGDVTSIPVNEEPESLLIAGRIDNGLIYNKEDSKNVNDAIERLSSIVNEKPKTRKSVKTSRMIADEEEGDDEEEEEEVTEKPRRRTTTTTRRPRRRTTTEVYEEDADEEYEEEEVKPKKKITKITRRRMEEEDEENEKERSKPKKSSKKSKYVEEEEEEDEETRTKKSKKPKTKYDRSTTPAIDDYYDDNSSPGTGYILTIMLATLMYFN